MSGGGMQRGCQAGARVATRSPLGCKDCIAGVIANAASFPDRLRLRLT